MDLPAFRTTADGDSTGNLTNLAIKGIIAIKAMSQISAVIHQDTDAEHYSVGFGLLDMYLGLTHIR